MRTACFAFPLVFLLTLSVCGVCPAQSKATVQAFVNEAHTGPFEQTLVGVTTKFRDKAGQLLEEEARGLWGERSGGGGGRRTGVGGVVAGGRDSGGLGLADLTGRSQAGRRRGFRAWDHPDLDGRLEPGLGQDVRRHTRRWSEGNHAQGAAGARLSGVVARGPPVGETEPVTERRVLVDLAGLAGTRWRRSLE